MKNYTKINQLYAEKCIVIANEMLTYSYELDEKVDITRFYKKVGRLVQFLRNTYLQKNYHWSRIRELKYHEFVEMKVDLSDFIYNNFKEGTRSYTILHIKSYELLDTYFNIKFNNDY